jgi:hypothetical protein
MQENLGNSDAIFRRLERLERENCRLKLAGVASLVVVAALLAMGAAGSNPDVISARKFVLEDAGGRVRAQLWMGHSGNDPQLGLYGPENLSMARLTASSGEFGPSLELDDGSGWPRVLLTLGKGNDPHLSLFEPAGKVGAVLFGSGPFGPSLRLHDANGYETDVGVREAGAPGAGARQPTSAASVVMLANGKERHVIWSAP